MIENKKKYQYEVIESHNMIIDFSKLYEYIAKEDNTDDPYEISTDFGDNTQYYLWQVFGVELKDYDIDELSFRNTELMNEIANDFDNWVDQNKVFEDLENGVE